MDFLEQLLGVDLDVTTRTLIAFVAVLVLILLVAWLFRRLSHGTARAARRGRIARLAILEAIPIDQRRRLVLLRRDNAEHLILIGGGSDLVIEQGIHRTPRHPGVRTGERIEPAARPPAPAHPAEPPPRPVPAARAAPPLPERRVAPPIPPAPAAPAAAPAAPAPAGGWEKAATERQLAEMAERLKAALREPQTADASPQAGAKREPAAASGQADEEPAVPAGTRRSE